MPDSSSHSAPDNFGRRTDGGRLVPEDFPLATLKQLPLLRGLSRAGLETARTVIQKRVIEAGATLIGEDDLGAALYFVTEGTFKITVRKGDGEVLLGLCGRGELLGELAAIDGHARSATVTAQTTCVVGALSDAHFWNALWPLAPVPLNMAHLLVGRVRRLTAKVQAMATLDVRGALGVSNRVIGARSRPQAGRGLSYPVWPQAVGNRADGRHQPRAGQPGNARLDEGQTAFDHAQLADRPRLARVLRDVSAHP